MMKLSIIIPVYNVEQYIGACLESVVNQGKVSKNDYEIIIINDGTQDSSLDIINNFNWGDTVHKVITQNNQGLSAARNKGLECASGEYVWFVDSDDYVPLNALTALFKILDGVDVINLGYQEVIDDTPGGKRLPVEYQDSINILKNGLYVPVQFHVFKKDFLVKSKLRFCVGIFHEDMEFTPRAIYLAKKIKNLPQILYYYRIRGGSIMTVINPKRAFDCLFVVKTLIKFGLEHGEKINNFPFNSLICVTINNALNIISQSKCDSQKEWGQLFKNDKLLNDILIHSEILKYKIEGLLFRYLPFSPIAIYRTMSKLSKSI